MAIKKLGAKTLNGGNETKKRSVIFDEPTNHLDFATKRIISDILEDYPGTIVMVSHDRYFVNRVANKIVYLH